MKTKLIIAALAIAITWVVVDRYYLLPEDGIEVMICGLVEKTTYRITGDQSDFDALSAGAPMEYTVLVMGKDGSMYEIEIDDDAFYRSLRVGDECIGIQTKSGSIASLLKR